MEFRFHPYARQLVNLEACPHSFVAPKVDLLWVVLAGAVVAMLLF